MKLPGFLDRLLAKRNPGLDAVQHLLEWQRNALLPRPWSTLYGHAQDSWARVASASLVEAGVAQAQAVRLKVKIEPPDSSVDLLLEDGCMLCPCVQIQSPSGPRYISMSGDEGQLAIAMHFAALHRLQLVVEDPQVVPSPPLPASDHRFNHASAEREYIDVAVELLRNRMGRQLQEQTPQVSRQRPNPRL